MIKNKLLFVALVLCLNVMGQTSQKVANPPLVQMEWVTDWSNHFITLPRDQTGNPWDDEVTKQILAQISEEEFEKAKVHYGLKVPCKMQIWCPGDKDKKNPDTLFGRLSSLKVYKIATYYRNLRTGKKVQYAILRVPYAGNEEWDEYTTWDTVYFHVLAENLKEVTLDFKQKSPPSTLSLKNAKIIKGSNALFNIPKTWWGDYLYVSVAKEIGVANTNIISRFFGNPNYPGLFLSSGYENKDAYNKKLSGLIVYRVVSFTAADETGKVKKYTIVRIPYNENKSWNPFVKWDTNRKDTLFMILPEEDIEQIGTKFLTKL